MRQLMPYILYAVGSMCYLVGSLMVIVEKLKQ